MIRLANELDLPAVAAIYEAILDHEDATGIHYTGWQRGAYPTADTARNIFDAGTLYVGVDETGSVWGSMNLNGQQLPEYQNGAWTIPAEDRQVAIIHTLTIDPARAGQGLARQMVAFAEDTARRQGKTVLRLDTSMLFANSATLANHSGLSKASVSPSTLMLPIVLNGVFNL